MRTIALMVFGLALAAFVDPSLAAQRRNNNYVLTADEIAGAKVTTAYEAVEMLRPRWLQGPKEISRIPSARAGMGPGRASGDISRPQPSNQDFREAGTTVYVNESSVGGLDYLKTIPAKSIFEMRWLKPSEAADRFGPTDGQAAVVVTLKGAH